MAGVVTILLVSQNLFAKTYGEANNDEAYSITRVSDGGYVMAGTTYDPWGENSDFLAVKIDPSGNLSWVKAFGGANRDEAYFVTSTSDGGSAIVGRAWTLSDTNVSIAFIKLDSSGNWTLAKRFGGARGDVAKSVVQTSNGGYAVAGYTNSFGAGGNDLLVLKLNPDGSLAWARTFGGTSDDYAYSIIQTTDGGYAVAGFTYSFGAGNDDFLVLKLNPDGSLAWARTFGGMSYDWPYSITQTTDGGYAVAGVTLSFGAGSYDFLLLKLNPDGSLAWARTFGGTDDEKCYSVIQTKDRGYIVAGNTNSFGIDKGAILVIKLDQSGNLTWARTLEGATGGIAQAADDSYLVAGTTYFLGKGDYDLFVLKMDLNGNYPDCVADCKPVVGDVFPTISSPSVGADCIFPQGGLYLITKTLSFKVTDVCPPYEPPDEPPSETSGLTCSPIPGGVLFISPEDMGVRIYSPDGRMVYLGNLTKGENRIYLSRGVYFWIVGPYKGKVAVG